MLIINNQDNQNKPSWRS